MGNCIRHQSRMQWAGEDWGAEDHGDQKAALELEGGGGGGGKVGFVNTTASASASSTEIKIKITKKQLEELLGKSDVKELSVQQVLAHLINVHVTSCTDLDLDLHHHQRPWRPALQSIPEVN